MTTVRKVGDYDSPPCWYDEQVSFMPELDSPRLISHHHPAAAFTSYHHHHHYTNCKQELELQFNMVPATVAATVADPFFQLPQLESPKVPFSGSSTALQSSTLTQEDHHQISNNNSINVDQLNLLSNSLFSNEKAIDQVTDWRVLDKFVASQLSHDDQDTSKETSDHYSNAAAPAFHAAHQHMNNLLANDHQLQPKRPEIAQDYASTSTSASCQIDLWK
ncbi:hypothetical protein PanWU01x14_199830 [Parasponia andersonii]|uniref:NAC domain containing protein n=1 Tax=Parasponia andersonii TaxID=3476 RepID=A0A2P5BYH4_PARAD|nr:hypothetical protein PanWU01x14_199830 [Parasponia andersonii]